MTKAPKTKAPTTKAPKTKATQDIEKFVEAEGRARLVKQVRKKIDELGIEYLYLQFISVTGRIMGKGIPADHWENIADKGFQLVYGATMNLFLNRRGEYLGYGPEAAELVGIPEPESFMQLPWDTRVARMWCTLFRNREERQDAGAFLTADCRGNLRRAHERFKADHNLELRVGTEPEMMWLKKDADGKPNGGYSNPYCYHIDQFESLRPVYMRVIEYCRKMGLDMIQGDHEDSPGQLELNFNYDDALRNADRLATYRQICGQVAREFDIIACFMCKPFMGVSANGCHHNISLWAEGDDEMKKLGNDPVRLPGMEYNFMYRRGGQNVFMPDTDDPQLPGKMGLRAIGGIVNHLGGLTAIGCSTVNSYRRLWDTGFWAPVFADWGFQNRTTGLRVSAPGRFEYRAVDSMVNPHLMASGLLAAMDHGLREDLDPGQPEERNIYQAMEAGKEVRKLPMTLGDALSALKNDKVIRSAMPGDMYRLYDEYKRDEWERFLHTTTEWDLETYLDCLP
ncbi:MAG TPA: glutamine synthetase family protein [Aestuariivirgaceae bacterium]|nr:glutamine synthetase family protein [Aestuariivirgaceae bacterium]